ncbi:hypothetical protein, partial [Phascolarctobacterium sp.]|uniref:hypothetical protein n=1 Tax=Phascolarctobacterium sp. TaxID=2049039 RepID=UPI0025F055FE
MREKEEGEILEEEEKGRRKKEEKKRGEKKAGFSIWKIRPLYLKISEEDFCRRLSLSWSLLCSL